MRLKRVKFREDVRLPQSPRFPSNYRNDIEAGEGVELSSVLFDGCLCVRVLVDGAEPFLRPWHEVREVIVYPEAAMDADATPLVAKPRGRPFVKKASPEA